VGVQQTGRPELTGQDVSVPAPVRSGRPAAVTIVLDPADDYANTRTVLAAHAPNDGRIVVHPTAGAGGLLNLAHDLLASMGKEPSDGWERRSLSEAWNQAAAWIYGYRISEVVILRAHLLDKVVLARLAHLAAETGAAITLVWHTRPPADWESVLPAATLTVLDGVQDAFARARERLPPSTTPEPVPMYCRPVSAQPPGEAAARALEQTLPGLPRGELPRFRAQLYRALAPEEFACADALYTAGMDSACAFLTGHRAYGHDAAGRYPDAGDPAGRYPRAWADTRALRSYLLSVVSASPSHEHSMTLIRGAQAGFLLHGLLLSTPADLGRHRGPGFFDIALTPAIADQIRTHIPHPQCAAALAVVLATGMNPEDLHSPQVEDLSDDGSTLLLRDFSLKLPDIEVYLPIPVFARDLLLAARAHALLEGRQHYEELLNNGFGPQAWKVYTTAEACGLDLQRPSRWSSLDYWHRGSTCVWVAGALHGNIHSSPGRQEGAHVPQA
jgi:hypothetical protein